MEDRLGRTRAVPASLDLWPAWTRFAAAARRLERAQAMGDVRALLGRGRRVCHVHLSRAADVDQLATALR